MFRRTLLALVIALVWLTPLLAVPLTLYVSPDGNDGFEGTKKRPLATLAGARDAVRASGMAGKTEVRVEFAPGTYRLKEPVVFGPGDSGTQACPVRYIEAAGQRGGTVLSGGQVVTGWREQAPGLWVASLSGARGGQWPLRDLYVNGRRATLARSPNEGYFRIKGKAAPLTAADGNEQDSSKRAFRFREGDLKAWDDVTGANVFVFYHWETGLLPIQKVDEATGTVTLTGEMKWPFWGNQRYFLQNTMAALDAPGEWYLDRDKGLLYYRPLPTENMKTATVVAPRLTQLVLIQGDPEAGLPVTDLRFEGLSFQHTNYVLEPEGHVDWQAAVTVNAALQANGARRCVVDNCEIARLGNYAVWFERGCAENQVTHCNIHNVGCGGVRLGTAGIPSKPELETGFNRVTDNFIHDLGYLFPGAIGVWIGHSSDNTVAHNEICDTYYSAISCGWSWGFAPTKAHRNLIADNYLHDIGRGKLCDMGAIYTLGISPGTKVTGNLIHDVWDWDEGYGAGGIYPDEGSSQIVIEGNVVYRTASGGLTVHYGRENLVRNNIFALGRDAQVHFGRRDKESTITFERNLIYYDEGALMIRDSEVKSDCNLFYNTAGEEMTFPNNMDLAAWRKAGHDVNSVIADPKFANPAKGDFTLAKDSPALALGFKPIDMSKVGITGPPELIKLARSIKRPVAVIPRRAQAKPVPLDDGFEQTPLDSTADLAYTHGEAGTAKIRVTEETAASGKRSLKFVDAPGLDQPWNPHVFYSPHMTTGTVTESFDLRLEPGATVWHEWRDNSQPFRVGPSLGIAANGDVSTKTAKLLTIPLSQWVHFEITIELGKQAKGTWDLTVTVPGKAPEEFKGLTCDPKCKELQWLGFVSNATETATFYLDNEKLTAK